MERCRRAEVKAGKYGAPEVWRRATVAATLRHRGMKRWSCIAGMPTWKHGSMELWRRGAGVVTWSQVVWRSGGALQEWRHGAMDA